jgi:hypothetical protein
LPAAAIGAAATHSCLTPCTPHGHLRALLYMQLHEATGKAVHVLLPDEVEYSRAVVM